MAAASSVHAQPKGVAHQAANLFRIDCLANRKARDKALPVREAFPLLSASTFSAWRAGCGSGPATLIHSYPQ